MCERLVDTGDMTLTDFSEYQNLWHRKFCHCTHYFSVKISRAKTTVCYCRVGYAKQRNDLNRKVEYMQSRYPAAEVVTDVGSGLNFKSRGLLSLLDRLHRGEKLTLVVAYRDRLARFGAELIERLIEQNGGELVVLNRVTYSPQEELAEDLHAILNKFSARL